MQIQNMAKVQQEILDALKRQSQQITNKNMSINKKNQMSHFGHISDKPDNQFFNENDLNRMSKNVMRKSRHSTSEIQTNTDETQNNEFNIYKNTISGQENIFDFPLPKQNSVSNNISSKSVSIHEKSSPLNFGKKKSNKEQYNLHINGNQKKFNDSDFEHI